MEDKNYYIAVNETFEVKKLSEMGIIADPKIKFLIKCVFVRKSSSLKTSYYRNELINIDDNTILWNGISCIINEDEYWCLVENPSHNGVALTATIKDRLNNPLEIKFDNTNHDDCAYQELFKYILDLNEYSTHDSVLAIKNRDSKILKLKEKIKALLKL